jgi:cytochrome c556
MHGGPFHVMKHLLFLLLLALPAVAADKPSDVVHYRQSVMKAMGAHMTATSLVVKKQISDRSQLLAHAESIRELSTGLASFFPPGTSPDKVKTGAKPELWQKVPEFRAAADTLRAEAAKLAEAAKKGDAKAVDAQFARVGAACGACHDRFRVKDAD